ncbi:hypothetical protein DY000_02015943 [Brassica cretica]|uniref:Uncharacterized protein n=1 Tax=Brassica cretica TaxID=69181 RepID=A0ABQ7D9X8_BRACR|nr:hypothetical protein DY000_02015943 [Brassica cretica]
MANKSNQADARDVPLPENHNASSFVSQSGLLDLPHAGNHLSCRGMRNSHFIQSRLDRAMANCAWSEMFPSGHSVYLRFEGSDHRPLLTLLVQTAKKKRGTFRFD